MFGINDAANSLLNTRASHLEGSTPLLEWPFWRESPSLMVFLRRLLCPVSSISPRTPITVILMRKTCKIVNPSFAANALICFFFRRFPSNPLGPQKTLRELENVYRGYTAANKEAHVADGIPGKDKHVGFELINMDIRKSKKDNELKHVLVCETLNVPSASSPHRHQNLSF
ncbi:Myo-inositol-1-phosphate synthase [Marasmius sp. AFHP31]|nr:Myo-inositol-1-phosphate synthase [Marasmius sp. AFHP31]